MMHAEEAVRGSSSGLLRGYARGGCCVQGAAGSADQACSKPGYS